MMLVNHEGRTKKRGNPNVLRWVDPKVNKE